MTQENFDELFADKTAENEQKDLAQYRESEEKYEQASERKKELEKQQIEKFKQDCNDWVSKFDSGDGPTKVAMLGGTIDQAVQIQTKNAEKGRAVEEGVNIYFSDHSDSGAKLRFANSKILMGKVQEKLQGTSVTRDDVANACAEVVADLPREQQSYLLFGPKGDPTIDPAERSPYKKER